MNDRVKFVDYQEPLSAKVERFLFSKGFDPATSDGLEGAPAKTDSLGILRRDPEAKPTEHLFGFITREPRRMFLGTIWFNKSLDSPRGASKQNWVLEMYGRKHIELVRQLAEEMALTFNVKIVLRIVREQPASETYASDFCY